VGAQRKILAVVKSNAYGLGAVPISKALQKAGTEWFGVTCANEGIELREAGIRKRILVLTGFWPRRGKTADTESANAPPSRAWTTCSISSARQNPCAANHVENLRACLST